MPKYTLYYRYDTCALATYIALEEAGAEFDVIHVEPGDKPFLSINPRGKVPTLLVDSDILRESVAILYYIAEKFPDAKLLPGDLIARTECISTATWLASELHINFRRIVKPYVYAENPTTKDEVKALGEARFRENLAELDGILRDGKGWVCGDQYSICDPYALHFVDWALWINIDITPWTGITGWMPKVLARPAVRKVLETTKRSRLLAFV